MPTKPTKKELERQVAMLNDALEMSLGTTPSAERDNTFFTGGLSGLYENRNSWDRKKIFSESMRAWRVNPIARRIVRLMTAFVIGKGIEIKTENEQARTFLAEWWKKNNLDRNLARWKDEDTRTGNLFILYNVMPDGMTILRAIPAEQIEEIETAEHDAEQELKYTLDPTGENCYPPYASEMEQKLFMRHYASNQPVGSPWGEADLSPLLVWIGRYSSWLEDRVRLNKYRTTFMYIVAGQYQSEAERKARETTLNANPPKSGSVLVTNLNNGEAWGTLSANLDSFDASVDGLTIKKMISAGVGFPMHFLAEPEGSTQTTAEAAGTPTFRTLEQTQQDYFASVLDMAQTALMVKGIKADDLKISGSDITERDNATLALALGRAYPPLADLLDRDGIKDEEFIRILYKMFAEVWDGKAPKIKRKPLVKPTSEGDVKPPSDDATDPGDPKEEPNA